LKAFGFFLREAWSSLRRNLSASFAAVTAIGAVLFLLSLLMFLSFNILGLAEHLRERKGISVFLATDTEPDRIEELEHHFSGFDEVEGVRVITRAEALADLEEELGSEGLGDALGENPLPDVLLITPSERANDAASLAGLAEEIEAYEGVEDVLYGKRWVEALDEWLRIVHRANAVTGVLAVLAIVLVLGNTLRLIVLMREEPIAILKTIGATDAFIRTPFVIAGVLLCVVGATVALGMLYLGFVAGGHLMPGMRFLPPGSLGLFVLGVSLVGIAGSLLTVELSLRQLEGGGGGLRD